MGESDQWTCLDCNAILERYFLAKDTAWFEEGIWIDYTGDEFPLDFNPRSSWLKAIDIYAEHCLCCDDLFCDHLINWPIDLKKHQTVTGRQLNQYMQEFRIEEDDIYVYDKDRMDCRTCVHWMTESCIPMRNWFRYHATHAEIPPLINLCHDFEIDAKYMKDFKVSVPKLQKTILERNVFNS